VPAIHPLVEVPKASRVCTSVERPCPGVVVRQANPS
jgi:hypothetical protein